VIGIVAFALAEISPVYALPQQLQQQARRPSPEQRDTPHRPRIAAKRHDTALPQAHHPTHETRLRNSITPDERVERPIIIDSGLMKCAIFYFIQKTIRAMTIIIRMTITSDDRWH
jgi:hypothetical protein